ncbi:MAG: S24 family peptidase [bacterium]
MQIETGSCGGEPFALRVVGENMLPEFIDGAVIIVDPSAVVSDGSYVVAEVNDEFVFRQIHFVENGYRLSVLDQSEAIVELENLDRIAGVVIQQTRRHKNRKRDTRFYNH